MLKRIFKIVVYFLGLCTLVSLICTACFDDETTTYIENVGPNEATLVVPDEPDSEVEVVVPEAEEPQADFVFIEGPECIMADAANYEFTNYIVGVVQNNTNKDYDYLQISFTLYDANGNVVDSAFANVNNIKAGGTWKFEAMFFEENVASWELDEITGW